MSSSIVLCTSFRRAAGAIFIALSLVGVAHAQVYEFNKFLSGGGGGGDPEKRRYVTSLGIYLCMAVAPAAAPTGAGVQFTIWSLMPHPNSRIRNIAFDTGRHRGLIQGISITGQSPAVKAKIGAPQPHAFLPRMTPDFWIDIPHPSGIGPGNFVFVTAALGPGKTSADAIAALNEGVNPATAENGLRVGMIVNSMLGGPPPGVATINDDGGFVTTGRATRCQR